MTYDSSAIWPADWSQFIPDVLSGLVTSAVVGIAVGVVLWKWQSKSVALANENAAVASWGTVRARVASTMTADIRRDTGREGLPGVIRQLDPFLQEARSIESLGAWAAAAPENEEIELMSTLVEWGPTVRRLAAELDALLRKGFARRGFDSHARAPLHLAMATSIILQTEWRSRTPGRDMSDLFAIAEEVVIEERTFSKVMEFQAYFDDVETAYNELRAILHGERS